MEGTISIIANICGILGFFISIFAASKVIKLTKSNSNSQKAFGNKNKQKMKVGGGK